ncbi:MAG: hypothetical protein JEZ04_13805 [Spirochaetales bacterium]|nr:hypothetical protein [Spirochaetales bacterium]
MASKNIETIKLWEDRFAEWKNSGLTRIEYCKIEELKYSTFAYWRKKLKSSKTKEASRLVKTSPGLKSAPKKVFELRFPNGFTLKIPETADPENLKMILKVLSENLL